MSTKVTELVLGCLLRVSFSSQKAMQRQLQKHLFGHLIQLMHQTELEMKALNGAVKKY